MFRTTLGEEAFRKLPPFTIQDSEHDTLYIHLTAKDWRFFFETGDGDFAGWSVVGTRSCGQVAEYGEPSTVEQGIRKIGRFLTLENPT